MCNIVNREATCVRRLATGRGVERLGAWSITFTANGEPGEVTSPPLCRRVCGSGFDGKKVLRTVLRKVFWPLNETHSRWTLSVKIFYLLWIQMSFYVIKKQCIWHELKRRKPSGERCWKQNGSSKFLNMCMQRSTVIEFCINACLHLFLENAF